MDVAFDKLSDPTIIGPGVWYVTHLKAKNATDGAKIQEFIDYMHLLADNFSCKTCRKHINQYIKDHPFEDLIYFNDENGRIGMFKWAWMFHNAVNTRIKKPYMDWKTAWGMYNEEFTICSENCTDGDSSNTKTEETIKILPTNNDRKSKLAQAYFMSIGIPNTLQNNGVYEEYSSAS